MSEANPIKELKYDFGADGFNQKNFFATEATLSTAMMAFNLMSLFRAPLKIAFYGNFVVTKFSREHVQVVRFPAQKFGCLKISRKNLIFRGAL